MKQSPERSTDAPRVAALVERFRVIGETSMRGLPFYNTALEVEAVGFRDLDGRWVGILITPWFMNLIRLPQQPAPMAMNDMGRKLTVPLPSGERQLMRGGDELIGAYDALSLHSPMSAFGSQEAARREARRLLAELMMAAQESESEGNGRLSIENAPRSGMSRRGFLTGAQARLKPDRKQEAT